MNKLNLKLVLRLFLLISIVFIVVYLYRKGAFELPVFRSYPYLALSLLFLLAGFVLNAYTWDMFLLHYGYRIKFTDSIICNSISILGKYIPGKIGAVVGRATYLSAQYKFPFAKLTLASLHHQLISIWTGLIAGTIPLAIYLDKLGGVMLLSNLMLIVLIASFTFSKFPVNLLNRISEKFFKKNFSLQPVYLKKTIPLLPYFFFSWAIWSVGFLFLCCSVYGEGSIDLSGAFILPYSNNIGIITLIAPGGLGVREGITYLFLSKTGFESTNALTISVTSRIWFMAGEALFLILGLSLYLMQKYKRLL